MTLGNISKGLTHEEPGRMIRVKEEEDNDGELHVLSYSHPASETGHQSS